MEAKILAPYGFVCEITGLDCSAASPAVVAELRRRLFEHRVLVIRGQWLSPGCYLEFMEQFGRPVLHVLQDLTVEGFPALLKISDYVAPDGSPSGVLDGGAYWHSDMSYLPGLGVATALYAVRAAARSGGTAFVDLWHGWQLVRSDQEMLGILNCRDPQDALRLRVAHRFGNRRALRDSSAAQQPLSEEERGQLAGADHHLVERHPVTGSASLYAISGSAMEVIGEPPGQAGESLDRIEEALLSRLEPFTHRYEPGDLVIWDNMSTLHRGTGVRPTSNFDECRLLYRINVNYCEEAS
jgi:taurine dioxygenase